MRKIKPKKIKDKKLEKIIEDFCSKTKTFYTDPYDIFDFAKKLNFEVIGKQMETNINSLLYIDTTQEKIEGFNSNKIIVYNSDNKEDDINFIIAHALARYIYLDSLITEENPDITIKIENVYQDTKEEIQKEEKFNKMASFILVPKVDFYFDLKDFKSKQDYSKQARDEFMALAKKYKVSYALLNRRLELFEMK